MSAVSNNMRQTRTILGLAGFCFLLSALTCAFAHGYTVGSLKIGHPWSRETPPGAKVGGGYLSIENTGDAPDTLVAVESDAAAPVQIHEMAMDNGVMKMRPLAAGIEIKPGSTVTLAPCGYHVMFMNLKEPFTAGAMVKAVLVFEKAGRVPVEFKVEKQGFNPAEHMGHMEHKS